MATLLLLLSLTALAAGFQPAALGRPSLARTTSPQRAASCIRMLDPSLAADASAAIVPAVESGIWEASWDAHTLDTLWPDLIHTTIYATLGLVGAYVTQVFFSAFFFLCPCVCVLLA